MRKRRERIKKKEKKGVGSVRYNTFEVVAEVALTQLHYDEHALPDFLHIESKTLYFKFYWCVLY